ncbi:MAG: aldehyde dehydrogenase family protein [Acidobacteria bacterium]|nr:aldehyde dehydrogenase family protein [Acidobacteriota bacterium]
MTPAVETKQPFFIGGDWVETGRTYSICLPYDGSQVAEVQQADAAAVDRAIEAARRAAPAMAAMSNADRSELLFRLHAFVARDGVEFANLIALETGKPIKEARFEVERALQTLLESALAARELHGEVIPMNAAPGAQDRMAITVREPVGVIAAITPFNVPFNLAMHKVGPALGSGNTVVHKPAAQTPLSALRFARAAHEAGLPAGAYNVVTGPGSEIGARLVEDPRVAMITFTGSVPTGKWIRASAGLKKVTLELGGNSALILEPDADLDLAVARAVTGAFMHSGQLCISVQRIFVHESIAAQFTGRFVEAARRLRIGHPLEETTDISSLISDQAAGRVKEWIDQAVRDGGRLLTGGGRKGNTIEPAIIADLPPGTPLSCQEAFGPVVAVDLYRDLDQAIDRANGTPFGLQSGIFTRDMQRAFEAARRLRVGGVLINDVPTFRADHMPYGGVKESGIGREGPRYAMEEMTDSKLICWRV